MNIIVSVENIAAIQAVLDAENGRAREHTISDAAFIVRLAQKFEAQAERLIGAPSRLRGAEAVYTSGGTVCNAYKYSRYVNELVLKRRKDHWHLVQLKRIVVWRGVSRSSRLTLTPVQDRAAHLHLRRQYNVRVNTK